MNPATAAARPRLSQKVAVSVVYTAAMFMSIMDGTIVNVALPAIGRDFSVSPTSVGSISVAYLVSLAVFIPASGWLGDRFGGKRVLLTALVIFTGASALCGIASSLGELVAFRILQGAGGAMLAPVGLAMLFRAFPPAERVRASSIVTVPVALAPAVGPVLGGLLVTDLSWRWVFYINAPIGVAAFVFGIVFLQTSAESKPGRFDVAGFVLSGAGLGLLMYGVSEGAYAGWGSTRVLTAIALGVVTLAGMTIVELRTAQPVLALRLLGNRLFRAANGVTVMVGISLFGTLYAISLYFQDGRGLSPLAAGLSSFPAAIGILGGAQLTSRVLYPRLGPRRLIIAGLTGGAVFTGSLSLAGAHTSLWWSRVLLFAAVFSLAPVVVSAQAAAFATITPAATGRASTMFNVVRQLGGAVGVALLTTTIVLAGPTHEVAGHVAVNLTAYQLAFVVAGAVCLLGLPSAFSIRDADAASTIRGHAPKGPRAAGPAPGARGRATVASPAGPARAAGLPGAAPAGGGLPASCPGEAAS